MSRILVCDDELGEAYQEILQEIGREAKLVSNPLEALAEAQTRHYDAFWFDYFYGARETPVLGIVEKIKELQPGATLIMVSGSFIGNLSRNEIEHLKIFDSVLDPHKVLDSDFSGECVKYPYLEKKLEELLL